MSTTQPPRPLPTGNCWCGCGEQVSTRSFFARGHDKIAEAALLAAQYEGTVAGLLHAHDYSPDSSVTAAAVQSGNWEKCGHTSCAYVGAHSSVRLHRRRAGH